MLLQPVPEQQAAARRLHQPGVGNDPVQPVLGVDRPDVRDPFHRRRALEREPVGGGQHRRVPTLARYDREMGGITAVAQCKIDVAERRVLAHALDGLVRVSSTSAGQSASALRLCSSENRVAQFGPAAAS